MAKTNSIEVESPSAFGSFDDAFHRAKNLINAIYELSSTYIEEDVKDDVTYFALRLHAQAAAICGLANNLDNVMEKEVWAAFLAAKQRAVDRQPEMSRVE